ncbi:RNA 2',3'-cyclic phosphodiesterase [Candidatus Pacearchaeota archaeon]|nr:RNA 2',3'-cyclic phosphodiesterase [Candidatus Pacearchaeota archaeon]
MRAFISLKLSDEAIEEIKQVQTKLANSELFEGKVTEEENLHLTLKFLGEIDDNVEEVKRNLRNVKVKKFKVKLDDIGVFSKDFIRIIWVKLEGVDELQKQIDESLENIFEKEKRYMGHLTIARVKSLKDKKKFFELLDRIKVKEIEFEVDRFYLMKSELSPKGPSYSVIEELLLD